MYDIADSLPDGISNLPEGTNLLIVGPGKTGKRDLALDLLTAGHERGDAMLFVMTRENAAELIADLDRRLAGLEHDHIGVIDCSGSEDREAIQDIATQSLTSPGDLTGISIGTVKLLEYFSDQSIRNVRYGLISITTLMQYLEPNTVFKFLHIYTQRISDTGGLGIFTIDDASHDSETVNTLVGEFDVVADIRETESGGREIRVRGVPEATRRWYAF